MCLCIFYILDLHSKIDESYLGVSSQYEKWFHACHALDD